MGSQKSTFPFYQIRNEIREKTPAFIQYLKHRQGQIYNAQEVFERWWDKNQDIVSVMKGVTGENVLSRLIEPYDEPWGMIHPAPTVTTSVEVVGLDGSQISPSRSLGYEYALVHVAGIVYHAINAPAEITSGFKLLVGDELWQDDEPVDADYVELLRDVEERMLLKKINVDFTHPIVALFDGTVEIFRAPGNTVSKRYIFDQYLQALTHFAKQDIVLAGYVDAPKARLFMRVVDALAAQEHGIDPNSYQPLRRLTDLHLFRAILQPGQRSSIVRLVSPSSHHYKNEVEIYLAT